MEINLDNQGLIDFNFLIFNLQEIENLTLDLETCQQQLQSKYGAVKIIQKLSRLEQARQKQHSRKALEASKKLEQVSLNMHGFELLSTKQAATLVN